MSVSSLLIIEDDQVFATVLAARLMRHQYQVAIANSTEQGLQKAAKDSFQYILLDMKIGDNNSLSILPQLRALLPKCRIILLTGYASIATAVEAIKSGADDYLAKPVDTATLLAALAGTTSEQSTMLPAETSMSPARLEWEHIQQVLKTNGGNVSATARQLGMHRRTLQRKLAKKPQH